MAEAQLEVGLARDTKNKKVFYRYISQVLTSLGVSTGTGVL